MLHSVELLLIQMVFLLSLISLRGNVTMTSIDRSGLNEVIAVIYRKVPNINPNIQQMCFRWSQNKKNVKKCEFSFEISMILWDIFIENYLYGVMPLHLRCFFFFFSSSNVCGKWSNVVNCQMECNLYGMSLIYSNLAGNDVMAIFLTFVQTSCSNFLLLITFRGTIKKKRKTTNIAVSICYHVIDE